MASTSTAKIVAPLAVGALAAAGAIAGSIIGARWFSQRTAELGQPEAPLAFEGWWNSDSSSGLAHAHPAVLFVDASTAAVVDSWDRRTRSRVSSPTARHSAEWPPRGILVLDAVTGDLLSVLSTPTPAAE